MSRYYFHSVDGTDIDLSGVDLPNDNAARLEAVRYAGDLLKEQPDILTEGHSFRVEVTDHDRKWLFTIVMVAVDPPREARR